MSFPLGKSTKFFVMADTGSHVLHQGVKDRFSINISFPEEQNLKATVLVSWTTNYFQNFFHIPVYNRSFHCCFDHFNTSNFKELGFTQTYARQDHKEFSFMYPSIKWKYIKQQRKYNPRFYRCKLKYVKHANDQHWLANQEISQKLSWVQAYRLCRVIETSLPTVADKSQVFNLIQVLFLKCVQLTEAVFIGLYKNEQVRLFCKWELNLQWIGPFPHK